MLAKSRVVSKGENDGNHGGSVQGTLLKHTHTVDGASARATDLVLQLGRMLACGKYHLRGA